MPIPGVAQATAYDADTGQVIGEQDLPKALAEGRAAFKQGSRVHLLDSSGKHVSVDAADVGTSLKQGYQLLSNEGLAARAEAKAKRDASSSAPELNPLKLALSNFEAQQRGATFGLSDVAGNAILGDEYTRGAAERKERNRFSGAQEFAGMIGGTIALGAVTGGAGTGLAARAGAGTARALGLEGLTGQAVSKGIQYGLLGGVEGAAQGAGKYASEATLANEKITAEKLASAAGTGALWGAATGGIMGAGGTLVGAGARNVLSRLSAGRPLQEAAAEYAEKKAFKALTGNARKYYDEALQYGGEDRLRRVGRRALEDGIPLQSAPKAAQAIETKLAETGNEMRAIAKSMDDAGIKVDARQVLDSVDARIKQIAEVPTGTHRKVAKQLEREMKPLREAVEGGREFTVTDFWDLRKAFGESVKWNSKSQSIAADELKGLYKTYSETLGTAISQADESAGRAWRAANEKYSDYRLAKDAVEDLITRTDKNRSVSPTDYLTGTATALGSLASGGGALLSMGKGAVVSALHKQLRERGPAYVAYAADALAKLEQRQASAVAAITDGSLLGKTTNLAASAEAARQSVKEDFAKRREVIDLFQRDPAAAAQRLSQATAGVTEADPQMGAELAQMAVGDAQYLAGHLPPPLSRAGYSFTPQAEDAERYAPTAMQQWLKRAKALDDPMSVVEDLARGELNREGIEALKERRPEMFRQLQVKVMTSLAEAKEPISYNRRVLLSLAFDFPGDKSLTPQYAQSIQAAYQPPPPPSEQGGQGQGPNNQGAAPPPQYAASLRL